MEIWYSGKREIEVTLYWCERDNSTTIEVWQPACEERIGFSVAGERALDAFYHPFAHFPVTPAVVSSAPQGRANS